MARGGPTTIATTAGVGNGTPMGAGATAAPAAPPKGAAISSHRKLRSNSPATGDATTGETTNAPATTKIF